MLLFFLILIFSWLMQLFLPWWSMVLVAAVLSFGIGRNFKQVILAGFCGCGILWLIEALYIAVSRGNLMTVRMAELFSLPASWLLFFVTFLLAAIAGMAGAWFGFSLRIIFKTRTNRA